MTTQTTKLRAIALAVTLATAGLAKVPAYASQDDADTNKAPVVVTAKPDAPDQKETKDQEQPKHASLQANVGFFTGIAVGAVTGGPIGAIVGGAAGAWMGDHYHKKLVENKTLAANLDRSDASNEQLTHDVGDLNMSLAESQARSAQMDKSLKLTDELQTTVSFRTNDATVDEQAVPGLMKVGALAASLPDVKVRVAGYADPRGSEKVNEELSQKRAAAVADVLASAGLPKDHLIVEGHGKQESTSQEGDLDAYAFDRKVTVRLEKAKASQVANRD